MSSASAIEAVTLTLYHLINGMVNDEQDNLENPKVTTLSPNVARDDNANKNQINLFLYGISVNTAFSNSPMPGQAKSGETGLPPLALVLKYLITAYGSTDEADAHRIMGYSMITLHDHPVLSRNEIETALLGTDLHNQIERVRITHDPLSVDDMSKLWTSFQSEYHLSTGYEVSVVLIESSRPATTPLPVLTRGIAVQPNLIPPYPTIDEIEYPTPQSSALLGDTITVKGHHLDGDVVLVRFTHPRLENPIDVNVVPENVTDKQIKVKIPDEPASWLTGFYTFEITITKAGNSRTTNVAPLSLSPKITDINPANPINPDGSGDVILSLTCSPEVHPDQRAALLLGNREVLANDHENETDTLEFLVENAPIGDHYIRLRIDGVDSHLIKYDDVAPPVFDVDMLVTIQ